MTAGLTMNEFFRDIASPYWWVSVVLVGLLIHLIAAYLKPFLDKVGSGLSASVRRRVEQDRQRFNREVQDLVENPIEVNNLKLDLLYFGTRELFWAGGLFATFLIQNQFDLNLISFRLRTMMPHAWRIALTAFAVFLILFQLICAVNLVTYAWKGQKTRDLLDEAEKRTESENPLNEPDK